MQITALIIFIAYALVRRSSWIDVRDLGLAHALAVKTPKASGERIIVSQSVFKLQDFGEHHEDYLRLRVKH